MYTVGERSYSEKSPKNLRIAKLFAQREVLMDLTEVVEYVFDTASPQNAPPFDLDSIHHDMEVVCPYCGEPTLEETSLTSEETSFRYDPSADFGEQFSCPVCGSVYPSAEEARECCEGVIVYKCENCSNIVSEDEYEALVTDTGFSDLKWYGVSKWLCGKLLSYGETVIMDPPLWGTESEETDLEENDAILEICKSIGILEGQPHEWKLA